jgi:hypothetical protein
MLQTLQYYLYYFSVLGIAAAVPILLFLSALLIGKRRPGVYGRCRRVSSCLALVWVGTTLPLLLIEAWYAHGSPSSDGFGISKSSELWRKRYWNPINSWGYRDEEYSPQSLQGKHVTIVLGDSFVAGDGINKIEDRFANRLEKLLGSSHRVLAVAQPGWHTTNEADAFDRIRTIVKPNKVILSYFVNDVEYAMASTRNTPEAFFIPSKPPLPWVLSESYFVDAVFWRGFRATNPESFKRYIKGLEAAAKQESVWAFHQRELQRILDMARASQSDFSVVMFPQLVDLSVMGFLLDRVRRLFSDSGVPVIDLREVLAGVQVSDRVVNDADAHPSRQVHATVAELLRVALFQ